MFPQLSMMTQSQKLASPVAGPREIHRPSGCVRNKVEPGEAKRGALVPSAGCARSHRTDAADLDHIVVVLGQLRSRSLASLSDSGNGTILPLDRLDSFRGCLLD